MQKKITDKCIMIPEKDREKLKSSEENSRKLELKEAKENLWRWRRKEESWKKSG